MKFAGQGISDLSVRRPYLAAVLQPVDCDRRDRRALGHRGARIAGCRPAHRVRPRQLSRRIAHHGRCRSRLACRRGRGAGCGCQIGAHLIGRGQLSGCGLNSPPAAISTTRLMTCARRSRGWKTGCLKRVEDLFVVKSEQDANPIVDIAVWSDTRSIDELTRLVEDAVATEFTALDGVAEVVLFGDRARVLRVEVRPDRLAAFELSIGEVADVLRAAQFDVPVGSFGSGALEVLVRADATVSNPERIEDLMLRDNVRLGDVATVFFGLATPDSVARLDGRMIVSLGIVRQAQSNTVRISNQMADAVERLKLRFPDLGFQITSDDAVFIKGSIAEVIKTLALALVIVIAVMWVFFGRLTATLIPAITIPIALDRVDCGHLGDGLFDQPDHLAGDGAGHRPCRRRRHRRDRKHPAPQTGGHGGQGRGRCRLGAGILCRCCHHDHTDRGIRADIVPARRGGTALYRVWLRAGLHRHHLVLSWH